MLGIGASTVLFYHSLRRIGATRTSAIFLPASAITGALAAFVVLREPVTLLHVAGAAALVPGLLLLMRSAKR